MTLAVATLSTPPRLGRQREYVKDYGAIAARIGTTHAHRLNIAMPLKNGAGAVRPGTVVHLTIEDITRHPAVAEHVKWVCRSQHCIGKHWESKEALLADHPDNRTLVKQEETHVYLAIAEIPAVDGKPEQRDAKGAVTHKAVDAQPPIVMLLSDQE